MINRPVPSDRTLTVAWLVFVAFFLVVGATFLVDVATREPIHGDGIVSEASDG